MISWVYLGDSIYKYVLVTYLDSTVGFKGTWVRVFCFEDANKYLRLVLNTLGTNILNI